MRPPASMVSARQAISNTMWLYGEKVINMVFALLVNIAIARTLGPAEFGTLSMLLSLFALVSPFMALGLNSIVTRELVNRPDDEGIILGSVMVLRLLGMCIAVGLVLVASQFWVESLKSNFVLVCILLLGNAFTVLNVLDFWFQSKMESRFAASLRSVSLLIFGGAKLVAAYWQSSLVVFVWIHALEWIAVGILFLVVYKRRTGISFGKWQWQASYAFRVLKEAGWLVFSGVAAAIYLKIDQLMLGEMVGQEAVGIYAVASRLAEVWYFFPAALAASFFPKMLKERQHDSLKYQANLQLLLDVMLLFALGVALGTVLTSGWLVPLLFGEAYQESVALLNIQIWTCCFIFMREVTSKWLIAESKVRYSLLSHGLGAIVNLLLNLWLIPSHGAIGAAWATLVSYFVASYLCFWIFPATRTIAHKMTKAWAFFFRIPPLLSAIKAKN